MMERNCWVTSWRTRGPRRTCRQACPRNKRKNLELWLGRRGGAMGRKLSYCFAPGGGRAHARWDFMAERKVTA